MAASWRSAASASLPDRLPPPRPDASGANGFNAGRKSTWRIDPQKVVQRFRLVAIPLTVFCWLGVWALFEVFPRGCRRLRKQALREPRRKPVPASTSAEVEAKYQNLERMIGSTEKRLDNLQKLLAALATVGHAVGNRSGASTYLNLKGVQASAEKLLVKIQDRPRSLTERAQRIEE